MDNYVNKNELEQTLEEYPTKMCINSAPKYNAISAQMQITE